LAGINYILSSFTGYTAGVINSFVLNRSWTFHNNNKKVTVQFARSMALVFRNKQETREKNIGDTQLFHAEQLCIPLKAI